MTLVIAGHVSGKPKVSGRFDPNEIPRNRSKSSISVTLTISLTL